MTDPSFSPSAAAILALLQQLAALLGDAKLVQWEREMIDDELAVLRRKVGAGQVDE